jgi:hypothetical protein
MKPAAALILALSTAILAILSYGAYTLRASHTDTATTARQTLSGLPADRSAPIIFGGTRLSSECSKTLRTIIEAAATTESSLAGILNNVLPLLLFCLVLQIGLAAVLFMVPGRVWQRVDG